MSDKMILFVKGPQSLDQIYNGDNYLVISRKTHTTLNTYQFIVYLN